MKIKNEDEINSGIYEKGSISFEAIYNSMKNNPRIKECGSIHSFSGIVRATSKSGKSVKKLTLEAYDELANNIIKEICEDIKSEFAILDIKIIHFKGEFEISDELVHVLVASAHRQEGFIALRQAVERYKKELAVWKKENFVDGSSEWAH